MKLVVTGLVMFAFSAASPALADPQTPAQPQPQVSRAAVQDQVICEREEDTGSRLTAHKICHTRSEWAQIQRDERQDLEHRQSDRSMNGN